MGLWTECHVRVVTQHLPPRHATGAASSNTHHYMSAGWKDWVNRGLLKISMHANSLNAGQHFPIG